jgi:hypothetical protein
MKYLMVAVLVYCFLSSGHAELYQVANNLSQVKWHLHIEKDTDVYGEIPLSGSSFSIDSNDSGEIKSTLNFNLKTTKSYELNKEEKKLSDGRDERIVEITQADKFEPTFNTKKVVVVSDDGMVRKIKIVGDMSMNGVTEEIELEGTLTPDKKESPGSYKFIGSYQLSWAKFKIGNPIMWVMKAFKTANEFISLQFEIVFNK